MTRSANLLYRSSSTGLAAAPPARSGGFVLVAVAMLLAMIAAMALILNRESVVSSKRFSAESEAQQLRFVAAAGLEHARWAANHSACTDYELGPTDFGKHRYLATFSPTSGSPVTIGATGVLANGLSRTVVATANTIYQAPTDTTYQPDAAAALDTFVDSANRDWNHGLNEVLKIRGGSSPRHALLRFDPGPLPGGARLVSAVLELHSKTVAAGGLVSVHRLIAGWTEGTQTAAAEAGDGATWDDRADEEPWGTPGGDYDPTPLDTTTVSAAAGDWSRWDVTAVAGDWVSGTGSNNGIILVPADNSIEATFYSSDHIGPALRPRLILNYACECGVSGQTGSVVLAGGGAAQDTRILNTQPASNYGSTPSLIVENSDATHHSLLQFDLSAIPAHATITSASLVVEATTVAQPGTIATHRLTTAWDESLATWQQAGSGLWTNPGGDFDPAAADSRNVTGPGKYAFDITAIAATWTPGSADNAGVILRADTAVEVSFASSENPAAGSRPSLELEFSCPCGADCSAADPGTGPGQFCEADYPALSKKHQFEWAPGAGDVTGIDFLPGGVVVNGTPVPAAGGWITSDRNQDRFSVTDVSGVVLTDFPIDIPDARGLAYVEAGPWAGHLAVADKSDNAVYFFDLDGVIVGSFSTDGITTDPYGLTFIGETLGHLYEDHLAISSNKDGTGGTTGAVYIVDQNGTLEKTIDVNAFAERPQGVAHLPGQDKLLVADRDGLMSIVHFTGTLLNQYDTATWGYAEMQGVTVHPDSCEHIVIDKNTKVVAALSDEPPTGGYANLLMVVTSPDVLRPTEQDKKTLFESWRHSVSLIDDNASAAQYAAAVTLNDVAYVGEDISAGSLRSKLTDAAIGVVNEEPNLADEFGLSAAIGWRDDQLLNIDDNDHYITRPFAPGPLTIVISSMNLAHAAGALAPQLRTLGSGPAGPMLFILPAAGEQLDSLPAAGRRVQLPWGGSNFEVGNLTGDGLTILKRSLEWGTQPPGRCDADFVANRVMDQFSWMPGTADIQGIDYLPSLTVVNGVTVPAGGGWIVNDRNQDRLFVADIAGNPLTDFPLPAADTQGVALIDAGLWIHHLAVVDKAVDPRRVYFLTLDGEIETSVSLQDVTTSPLGLDFIGATAGGIYDNHLVVSADRNASGDGTATVSILDQSGNLVKTLDVEAFSPTPRGISHLTGADKLLVVDKTGTVSIIDFDGVLLHRYSTAVFGLTEPTDIVMNPATCAHVVVDRDLETITSLGADAGAGGGGPRYVETYTPWQATAGDTWETVNLGLYGVPANAVAEVAIVNADGGKALWGGVRKPGSGLDRRMQLHEAGGGGADVAVMHVQTGASGRIEHYSDDPNRLSFVLLGYWTASTYVETWTVFKAGADAAWQPHALDAYGVGAGQVTEILMANNDALAEHDAGVRTGAADPSRVLTLHEARDGGVDTLSATVVAGPGAGVQVYAGSDASIDFYLAGYWSSPPGTYTGAFADMGKPSSDSVWETKDPGAYGVPADAVAQIALVNREPGAEGSIGVRAAGSGVMRLFDLHEADNGGDDVASVHVNTDSGGVIQWYDEDTAREHRFYLLGWWQLP